MDNQSLPKRSAGPFDIELEPGERVLYVDKPDYTSDRHLMWIFGALLLPVVVGIVFIVMAIKWNRWNPAGNVVTNRRFIHVKGNGLELEVPLEDIVDVDVQRRRTGSGGGLVSLAISASVSAIADHFANQNAKLDPKFWAQGIALIVITRNGVRHTFRTKGARKLGPFIVNVLTKLDAMDQFPSVT